MKGIWSVLPHDWEARAQKRTVKKNVHHGSSGGKFFNKKYPVRRLTDLRRAGGEITPFSQKRAFLDNDKVLSGVCFENAGRRTVFIPEMGFSSSQTQRKKTLKALPRSPRSPQTIRGRDPA